MFITYYDESGDDGFPKYSSKIFVLSALYLHHLNWKDNYERIHQFRIQLHKDFNLPVKLEFHTKPFMLSKNPYKKYYFSDDDRVTIVDLFCELISQLEIKIVNTVINKTNIGTRKYAVLDKALTYSIQRIENDLNKIDPIKKFIIITDSGRISKMRRTTRKIQKINYIPSKYSQELYRKEIKLLIEDPLPKESKESYFIQICDLIAYIVYLYSIINLRVDKFPNRMPTNIDNDKVIDWMEKLKGSLNLEASNTNEYGIVCYLK